MSKTYKRPHIFHSSSVLASLRTVHETLSRERQKLQEVWETNNIHQSNTLAEVSFTSHLSSGFSGTFHPLLVFNGCFSSSLLLCCQPAASHGPPSATDSAAEYFDASADVLCGSSSELSDESGLSDGSTTNSEPEEGHGGYIYFSSISSDLNYLIMINIIILLSTLQSQPPGSTVLASPRLLTLLFQRAPAGGPHCLRPALTTAMWASWLSSTTT